MLPEQQLEKVNSLADAMLVNETEFFKVNIKIKPTNNIKVFIDGDNGMPIEKCVYFNRQLYKAIDESGLFGDGDFSLEVSSPGVDEPLKLARQYPKNVGRNVEVVFNDGSIKEGKLVNVAESDIIIEQTEGKGKKATAQQIVIPFNNIKTVTVKIKF